MNDRKNENDCSRIICWRRWGAAAIKKLGYNSSNDRYGLLSSDLWIDTGFHCGECLEVLIDDQWVQTRMEMNPAREWYLVGTPYCGDLEYIRARIQ